MVAVITVNYNLSNETIPCIESILNSDYDEVKIFLIDNGSSLDDYKTILSALSMDSRIQMHRINENKGYVRGVNTGLNLALDYNPDYCLVMNNDTIIDKSAISNLVTVAIKHHNRAIVSGKVYYYHEPDVLQHTGVLFKDKRYMTTFYPGQNEKDVGQCDTESERDSLDDVYWLIPNRIIKDVGLYSDYFFLYAEQGDYAQRARHKGYKLIYAPKARLWHKVSKTTGGGDDKALPICYWRGQGMFVFQYRNLRRKYFVLLMLKLFIKFTINTLIKKGKESKCFLATLRGYCWGFRWMFNKKPNNGYNPYMK